MFTRQAEAATGEQMRARITMRCFTSPAVYPELRAASGTACRRDGYLTTANGRRIAKIASVYLPGRIPMPAIRLLGRTATPLGTALAPYGVQREELDPIDGWTRGLLWLPSCDQPVAMAWEYSL